MYNRVQLRIFRMPDPSARAIAKRYLTQRTRNLLLAA